MPTMKTYLFGALIAATVVLAEALLAFDPAAITDWRAWAAGIAGGVVRQLAVYVLAKIAEARA